MSTLSSRRLAPHLVIGLALPFLAGAGTDEAENWLRLQAMPRDHRMALAEKIEEFDRLSRAQQTAVRTLDEKLGARPAAERSNYLAVLRRYHLWLKSLSEEQRAQIVSASSHKEKLALMAKFRNGQSQDSGQGSTVLLFQLADLHGRSPIEVAQMLQCWWFTLGPDARSEIEKLGVRDRMKRLFELAQKQKAKLEPLPSPSPRDLQTASELLDKSLQTKSWLRKQLKKDSENQVIDRGRLVNNYYFVANPPKPVTSANLLIFETAMPSWIRSSFDHLTPEEARRRLTILYRLIYPAGKEIPPSGPTGKPAAAEAGAKPPVKAPAARPTPGPGPGPGPAAPPPI